MKTKKHEKPLKVNMTDKGLLGALIKPKKVLKKDAQKRDGIARTRDGKVD